MRLCMISPHYPPDQAANALLPVVLGQALESRGVVTRYVAHTTTSGWPSTPAGDVVAVPRRGRDPLSRTPVGALVSAGRMALRARQPVRKSDLVHLHSNGLIVEVGQRLAARYRKPYVITLYGTDVWHHDPVRHRRFGRVVREAACRVFYSQGLREFGASLGLAPEPSVVIYAPVSSAFRSVEQEARRALRAELGIGDEPLVLTVKRLHAVAGHAHLLQAVPHVLGAYPEARIWLVGEGELRPTLEKLARDLGVASHVRFLGRVDHEALWRLYAAADLFVLPSSLESWGTVMLEALACGTPVVATYTAGGVEVRRHFPDDVTLVEKENPDALAGAVRAALMARRRTAARMQEQLRAEFSVARCAARYFAVYHRVLGDVGSENPAHATR